VQPHNPPVHRFVERIDSQQRLEGLNGGISLPTTEQLCGQVLEDGGVAGSKTVVMPKLPFLELEARVATEGFKKVAAIELSRQVKSLEPVTAA
jgi:hypothetical protein